MAISRVPLGPDVNEKVNLLRMIFLAIQQYSQEIIRQEMNIFDLLNHYTKLYDVLEELLGNLL